MGEAAQNKQKKKNNAAETSCLYSYNEVELSDSLSCSFSVYIIEYTESKSAINGSHVESGQENIFLADRCG